MYCDASNCTGKHSNNLWGEMCSAARERKRVRQRAWVRSKYYNNPGWASEKRWANLYYKSTAAGICSAIRSRREIHEQRLSDLQCHLMHP